MTRPAALLFQMVPLLIERGCFTQKPGEPCQPIAYRLRAIRWHSERFAEMVAWDDGAAQGVMDGDLPFHASMMSMRLETGQYDGAEGDLRYEFDVLVQQVIDPTVDVRRY